MNKLVTKILKESGVDAKITRDEDKPKFRVKSGQLTLEGVVTSNSYSMKITDKAKEVIDEFTVSVKNSNDIVNRINESINTLNTLSPIYDKQMQLKEDEEFEELPQAEPGDIKGALVQLDGVYDELMDLAERTDGISDYFEEDDVDGKQNIISFVSGMYDLAMDISDYKEDKIEEMEAPVDESYKPRKSTKSALTIALEHITIASASLASQKNCKDIKDAIDNIKAELTVRGVK